MSDIISPDTALMREWSGSIDTCASDYDGYIKSLYGIIDDFMSSGFTGDMATELEGEILANRTAFEKVTFFLQDVVEVGMKDARKNESDTAEIKQKMNQSGIIN